MSDIKQAAEWMKEGRKVRRPRLSPEISLGQRDGEFWIRVFVNGKLRAAQTSSPFSFEDLLADDWEIAK